MARLIKRILVIEDDPDIAALLTLHLVEEGFAVEWVGDGETGLAKLTESLYDLVILDLVLPGIDGLEVCRVIRNRPSYTPIIILSSKSAESQRIVGLEMGADDYLTKPFSVFELVARVRAVLRRIQALKAESSAVDNPVIVTKYLRVVPRVREVFLNGQQITLTAREFDLLLFFVTHPNQIYTRLQLLDQVWGYSHDGYEHTVNSHINRLRSKIEVDPAKPEQLVTAWGVGYKFCHEDS